MKPSILVVDDEPAQRQLLAAVLAPEHEVTSAANGREAKELLENRAFDLVITDDRMPEMSGIALIEWARNSLPETPIVVLTAHGSIETAVEAMKLGAHDYLTKPIGSPDELRLVVAKALRDRRLAVRSLAHDAETEVRFPQDVVADSPAMKEVLILAARVAPEPTTVLLTGESGTGKEVVARFIHRHSRRGDGPFVAVNCAALNESLLESELFGHEKGAFTGATRARAGRFEMSHGGTLFLDEIGEMGPNLQAKLLRVLEEREFERVGGTRTISVDVRVIAATNRDPAEAVASGTLREDLYYRLSVFPIHIPPLRERPEDIIPLAEHFVHKLARRMGRKPGRIGDRARERIRRYDWPGNVRELQNAIERAMIVSDRSALAAENLPLAVAPGPGGSSEDLSSVLTESGETLADIERRAIIAALERNDGDRKGTAKELGVSLRKLQYRLKEYGLTQAS